MNRLPTTALLVLRSLFVLCTAALLAAVLLSCGSSSATIANNQIASHRIALVAPVHSAEQAEAMRIGAEAAARQFGLELNYAPFESNEDAAEQLAAAIALLEQGAEALLIAPADEETLRAVGQYGTDRGIPVIALNDERMPRGVGGAIAIDNEEAGRQAGKALAELLDGKGNVALLKPDRNDPGLVLREQGILEALSKYPSIQVKEGSVCGNLRDACWVAAKSMLDNERLDGAIALQSVASLGLADEVRRRSEAEQFKLVAFGSEREQLELLQEGVIHQLVVQSDFSTGYIGVEQAVSLLAGGVIGKPTLLETRVVDADNMFWMNNQKLLFPFVH
ncbi:substrate-binding domain-containing protein [Paenibacillus sp. GCM10012307]|uniref:Substrate-binding domain-containing protein n=1 Tax=Paenibacillus roseus TaxID=2798579 RepID=A0A934J819_9BACL|nr:substrate-binding domain-containing protein [Paenibacillus roseus]MBJ6362421.1 substrate-binding domain-containing protein [Paenibacillus roseus]